MSDNFADLIAAAKASLKALEHMQEVMVHAEIVNPDRGDADHIVKLKASLAAIEAVPDPVAWQDVLAERERQKSQEGWTIAHDDEHTNGSLAQAAACYAAPTRVMVKRYAIDFNENKVSDHGVVPEGWPESWASCWFKPKDRRRDLIKAGALILAEIERLDRASVTVKP